MAFTQTQLDALDAAIAGATLRVSYDGKTIEYRSMDDLIKARGIVADALLRDSGMAPSRSSFASFSRG